MIAKKNKCQAQKHFASRSSTVDLITAMFPRDSLGYGVLCNSQHECVHKRND